MSDTKFSAGPLTIESRKATDYYPLADIKYVVKKNAAYTALVPMKADAILYAAAPDLYAACEALLVAVNESPGAIATADAVKAARTALAKARGEELL